jgi:uncharacterized membrane protein (DUF2068 family)
MLAPAVVLLSRQLALMAVVGGLVSILFGLIDLILAYGLWKGRRWAWIFALVISILEIVFSIFALFLRPRTGELIVLVMELVIVYLLMQPGVQRYCGKRSTTLTSGGTGPEKLTQC